MINAKVILASAALFAAPAMAQTSDDLTTVKALVNMVAVEQVCGLKIPVDALYDFVGRISPRLPNGSGEEFGKMVRQAGIARAQEIVNSGTANEFCFKAVQLYRKYGY